MTKCGIRKVLVFPFAQKLKESDTGFLNPHAKIMTEREMNPGVSLLSSLI